MSTVLGEYQIHTVVSPVFGTNCYVIVKNDDCVIVDPGAGVAGEVLALVRAGAWKPWAVIGTHGHPDHLWDAGVLSQECDVPCVMHHHDLPWLAEPVARLGTVGTFLASEVAQHYGVRTPFSAPRRVNAVQGAFPVLSCESLTLHGLWTPGHTEGSTVWRLDDEGVSMAFTGDVIFAGAMGRTDFIDGNQFKMDESLLLMAEQIPHECLLFPGHGPRTIWGDELRRYPHLSSGQ